MTKPKRLVLTAEGDPALRELADHLFGDQRQKPEPAPETAVQPDERDFLARLFNKEN